MSSAVKVVKLSKPIKLEGQEVWELKLREPTVAELLAQDEVEGEVAQLALMTELLAEIPRSAVLQIAAKDFGKCAEAVMSFLDDTPTIGG